MFIPKPQDDGEFIDQPEPVDLAIAPDPQATVEAAYANSLVFWQQRNDCEQHLGLVRQALKHQTEVITDLDRERNALRDDRDRWIRLFNRLDAAITHHRNAYGDDGFCADTQDDALWAARDKVLADAAK